MIFERERSTCHACLQERKPICTLKFSHSCFNHSSNPRYKTASVHFATKLPSSFHNSISSQSPIVSSHQPVTLQTLQHLPVSLRKMDYDMTTSELIQSGYWRQALMQKMARKEKPTKNAEVDNRRWSTVGLNFESSRHLEKIKAQNRHSWYRN